MHLWPLVFFVSCFVGTLTAAPLEPLPHYSYSYPAAVKSLTDSNEVLISNGSITAFLVNQGATSFFPNQLKRVLAPPYLLNNQAEATLLGWGYDDHGYHAVENRQFTMDYALDGARLEVDHLEFQAAHKQVRNNVWQVSITYRAVPGTRALMATYRYRNNDRTPHPLTLAGGMNRPQVSRQLNWTWDNPAPGLDSAVYDRALGHGAIVTASARADAFLVFGLDQTPTAHAVSHRGALGEPAASPDFGGSSSDQDSGELIEYLAHDFGSVAPGQSVSLTMVLAIAGTKAQAQQDFLAAVAHPEGTAAAASAYWDQRWASTKLAVKTPDGDLDRMANLALTTGLQAWDQLNQSWVTGFGGYARGIVYRWDTHYSGFGFLLSDPVLARVTIKNHLSANWRQNYAYRIFDHVSLGAYYAYNHISITNLVYQYVAATGDLSLLRDVINGRSVLQILQDECLHIDNELHYDFGGKDNLLEVVSRYVGTVPDLVAHTYWMANKIEALALLAGQADIAASMRPVAATAYAKTQALWQPEAQWFTTGSGDLVYSVTIFDMLATGALSPRQVHAVLSHLDEFVGPYGVRSLARRDPEYNDTSPRGDWDGPGAYVALPGAVTAALAATRQSDDLYRLSKGIARWWQWRPLTTQGVEAATGQAIGPISYSTVSAAARYVDLVPFQLVGLHYSLGGLDVFDNIPRQWSNLQAAAHYGGAAYAAMVRIPVAGGGSYSVYIDKPQTGPSHMVAATLITQDASGAKHAQAWPAQRLPIRPGDVSVILHFASTELPYSQFDELTQVVAASLTSLTLRNPWSSVDFRTSTGLSELTFVGRPNQDYQVIIDDALQPTSRTFASGNLRLQLALAPGQHRVRLIPVN